MYRERLPGPPWWIPRATDRFWIFLAVLSALGAAFAPEIARLARWLGGQVPDLALRLETLSGAVAVFVSLWVLALVARYSWHVVRDGQLDL